MTTADKAPTIDSLALNLLRVFRKMKHEVTPGKDEDSNLIDLINHGETIVQQIREELK